MNYCQKIHYTVYATQRAGFSEMVDNLLSQLPENETILRLSFFGTPSSNIEYVERRVILRKKIREYYGDHEPALSYVSQPPMDASLIMEVHSYRLEDEEQVTFRHFCGLPYVILENEYGRFLFAGGFQGDVINYNIEQQSADVFNTIMIVLKKEGFPINSIIRQWNYIEHITAFDGENQHYQSFNNARTDFYKKARWTNGYPAATGIGASFGGVLVDLDAAILKDSTHVVPIDNKLQVAAHAYSEQVLAVSGEQKTTPKFERAKSLVCDKSKIIYISGTAAIRGENSLEDIGLGQQLRITMENIDQLAGNARLCILRVYLKDRSFYEEARKLMDTYHLNIPVFYMCADICRNELLIEIEGIARL